MGRFEVNGFTTGKGFKGKERERDTERGRLLLKGFPTILTGSSGVRQTERQKRQGAPWHDGHVRRMSCGEERKYNRAETEARCTGRKNREDRQKTEGCCTDTARTDRSNRADTHLCRLQLYSVSTLHLYCKGCYLLLNWLFYDAHHQLTRLCKA